MTARSVPCLLTLAVLAARCAASTVFVNAASTAPTPNGASWVTAFPTVQQGLAAASSGDEVWVAVGTYKENLTLKSGVGLYGGFAGNEVARSHRNPQTNLTILDGQFKATVVRIAADATSDTVLDGFTIQGGQANPTGSLGGMGGGVYITSGSPIISNNTIAACRAFGTRTVQSYGGGIYVADGMPLIAGNTIYYNGAIWAGGIYAPGGLIRDNLITGNVAAPSYSGGGFGGGMNLGPRAVAVHNVISDNGSYDDYGGGGGVACNGSAVLDNIFENNTSFYSGALVASDNATIIRNRISSSATDGIVTQVDLGASLFSDNVVSTRSGIGVALWSPGEYLGKETLVSNNTIVKIGPPADYGVVCYYRMGDTPVIANNVVMGWAFAGQRFDIGGTPPVIKIEHNDAFGNTDNRLAFPGTSVGNISQDPLFVDPANGDYRLQAASPCIDAGNDAYVASGDRDAAGAPRIYGAHVDIGAYEYGSPLYTMLDAAEVLRIAAGISIGTPANVSRLDVVPQSSGLTILDATRIAQWLLN